MRIFCPKTHFKICSVLPACLRFNGFGESEILDEISGNSGEHSEEFSAASKRHRALNMNSVGISDLGDFSCNSLLLIWDDLGLECVSGDLGPQKAFWALIAMTV